MEVEVHSTEVDLQFSGVLLLLKKLLLRFSLLPRLTLLELFLGLARLSLFLFVVLLLLVIKLFLLTSGDWHWRASISEVL